MTQKELVQELCEVTGNKYTQDGISRKLSQGTMSYNEAMMIADILGYDIEIIKRK